jgi:hypothetical protein
MGMPLTSFSVMQALLEFQRRRYDKFPIRSMEMEREIRRCSFPDMRDLSDELQRFSLLAFVLHSPERHPDLHRKLERDFEILDQITGEDLLFFTVIEPSEDWVRSAGNRHYLSKIKVRYMQSPRGLACADSDAALCAIARAFSISSLPAIVVIDPRDSRDRVVIETSAIEIEQQLGRLGQCAQNYETGLSLAGCLEKWNLGDVLQLPPDRLAMSRAIFALAGIAASGNDMGSMNARELLQTRVSRILGSGLNGGRWLRDARWNESHPWDVEPDDALIGLILDAAFYRGALHTENSRQLSLPKGPDLLVSLDRNSLELETSGALASADAILKSGATLDDFSPVMICIGKAFESEINASIVQWYRQQLGVNMPQFFKRHAPGVSAVVNSEVQPVDFNARRRLHGWHPPSLGASLWAGTHHFQANPEELTPEQFGDLTGIWKDILSIRNQAAHPGMMSESDFERAVELWGVLKNKGLIQCLLDLKERIAR